MIDEKWVILAAVLNSAGGLTYLVSTVRGITKPNRVTWLLWAVVPLVAFVAQLADGVRWPAVMTLAIGVSPLLIFLASFLRRGSGWRLRKLDYACGGLALVGIGLWQSLQIAVLAIVFSIVADTLAAIPTLIKAYRSPETENCQAFVLGAAGGVVTLCALQSWTFVSSGFAVYYLVLCTTLTLLIWLKPRSRLQRISPQPAASPTNAALAE